jgi:hypothetical protein
MDASITTDSIASREGCSARKVNMTISLAPDLVKAAIDGRLPHGMGVARLTDHAWLSGALTQHSNPLSTMAIFAVGETQFSGAETKTPKRSQQGNYPPPLKCLTREG